MNKFFLVLLGLILINFSLNVACGDEPKPSKAEDCHSRTVIESKDADYPRECCFEETKTTYSSKEHIFASCKSTIKHADTIGLAIRELKEAGWKSYSLVCAGSWSYLAINLLLLSAFIF